MLAIEAVARLALRARGGGQERDEASLYMEHDAGLASRLRDRAPGSYNRAPFAVRRRPRLEVALRNGSSRRGGAGRGQVEDEPAKRRRCTASWARLIGEGLADPFTCRKCGAKLKIVAYLHDTVAIKQILDHLGLARRGSQPPPAMHEVVRVPVDEEGRESEAP